MILFLRVSAGQKGVQNQLKVCGLTKIKVIPRMRRSVQGGWQHSFERALIQKYLHPHPR